MNATTSKPNKSPLAFFLLAVVLFIPRSGNTGHDAPGSHPAGGQRQTRGGTQIIVSAQEEGACRLPVALCQGLLPKPLRQLPSKKRLSQALTVVGVLTVGYGLWLTWVIIR